MILEYIPYKEELVQFWNFSSNWMQEHVLTIGSLKQLVILVAVFLVGYVLRSRISGLVEKIPLPHTFQKYNLAIKEALQQLVLPIFLIILLWFSVFTLRSFGMQFHILNLIVSLLNAWVVIRIASHLIKDEGSAKALSFVVWIIAALNIVDLLDVTIEFLQSFSFSFGDASFSALGVIKGLIAIAILYWLFSFLETIAKKRIDVMQKLTPSAKVLLKKFLRIALVIIGVLLGMDAMGIDLTALAVFSGAIGIGLGFGLQKVASNLVSGVILLLDHSVKPGDVIALGDTYGHIDKLGGRYVSVITRDGTEHLIPNEELITQRVENWSFSDTNVRQRAMIGVDYGCDIRKALELCVEAAMEVPRIVKDPPPRCLLRDFADNSVHIELRFWVNDAQNGLGSVRSDVLLLIWDKFHEHGISFPFPQRDLHIKGTVPVRLERAQEEESES